MYLKQLELIGFKSFADHTRLNFSSGITAIVGPNGCGKSNLVDSIKWVLGEQSAKSLRSTRMEDVIFHGTDDRKGIGMAEVSVTFDNSSRKLPLEFSEVTITRRVFRSGEGQYFINKNLCRLKDIDDLFMDTGVGMSAYSVFEQGKMDLILSSKPEDRRFIFEEAAGITKYKERRRETLHKLEITEQNLIRLNDIIKEVQRQLNSIERAAAKARRYKSLSDELRQKEAKLLIYQLKDLQGKALEYERAKLLIEEDVKKVRQVINERDTRIANLRQELRKIDDEISFIHEERLGIETRLVDSKHKIQYNQTKIKELVERNRKIDIELESLNKDLFLLQSEIQNLLEELKKAQEIRIDYKNKIDEKANQIKSLDANAMDLNTQMINKKEILIGKASREAQIKNEIAKIEFSLRDLILKNKRDSVELNKKRKQRDILSSELAKTESILNLQKSNLLGLRQKIKDNEERVVLLKDEVANISRILRDKQLLFTQRRSEYEIFSKQKRELEGYTDGVKFILENKMEFPGVIGLVEDIIHVPKEYVESISAVLGNMSQWVVVDTLQNAYRLVEKIQNKDVSQVVALVLELLPNSDTSQIVNFGIRALDILNYDKAYEKLVRFLLGNVLIVDDVKGLNDIPWKWILVSRDGRVLNPQGIVSVGKHSSFSIISRDSVIDELKDVLDNLSNEILQLTEKYNSAENRLLQEERQLEVAKNILYNEEISLSVQENDFLSHKDIYDSICEEINILEMDGKELEGRKQELLATKNERENELVSIAEELKSIQTQIDTTQALLEKVQKDREITEREYSELKILLVSAEEKENLLEFKRSQIQGQIDAINSSISKISNEKLENMDLIEKLKEEISMLEKDIEEFSKGGLGITQRYSVLKETRYRVEKQMQEEEEALHKERQSAESLYSRLNDTQLSLTQISLKIDNIVERLQNEYKMAPDNIDSIVLDEPIEVLEQEIITIKEKLDSMGEVSLVAIQEQDDLIKRHEFLNSQRQDLVNAKESLLKAIAKLNTTTKKLFWDTFCQIRENFNSIFQQLFGGGKADLALIDESDILESGIEIIVRPPGKRLQNVSLLSGGEKTLTAIALLFSIFKTKPSPFCIMDEIDAPLDDSNIDRFIELLKEFAKTSQFIIVTHNKRTISAADVLYGITMQETGVSKVVSVRFAESNARWM